MNRLNGLARFHRTVAEIAVSPELGATAESKARAIEACICATRKRGEPKWQK